MKETLIKNIEKVLLTVLLMILAGCSVFMILTMDREDLKIVKDGSGLSVKVLDVAKVQLATASLEEGKPQPYDSKGYIYCRNTECNYLIHRSLPKCTWCGTDTRPPVEATEDAESDKDNDGITDADEVKLGLNPEDPNDALLDKDSDGFSNLDEVKFQSDISDPDDHPSVINRTKLHPRIRLPYYYPITFSNFGINKEDDKKTWDIYADIYVRGRSKSIFMRVNETVDEIGYTIIDVKKDENGKEFIVIQKEGEEPVEIPQGKKKTIKSIDYFLINELTGKPVKIQLGSTFELVDKNGNKEKYKAESFDSTKKTLNIIDYMLKDTVEVGLDTIMREPGVQNSTSSFEEGLLE